MIYIQINCRIFCSYHVIKILFVTRVYDKRLILHRVVESGGLLSLMVVSRDYEKIEITRFVMCTNKSQYRMNFGLNVDFQRVNAISNRKCRSTRRYFNFNAENVTMSVYVLFFLVNEGIFFFF